MRKSIIPTFLLFLLAQFGQSQSTISGSVYDDDNHPIFFATVALYDTLNKDLIKAVSTDDKGLFTLNDITKGNYYLEVTMLGYKNYVSEDFSFPQKMEFAKIQLDVDANLLSTVEIKARVPLLEQKADKLIVNVENNITNTSGSLLDVMKKVPGMLVINDRLSIAGAGSPTILINGKTTQYMDIQSLLRDMPGDNIKTIEIIHQPGAEYEASGSGPIINIILKKNGLVGTNGNITLAAGKGDYWDYNGGLNLSHYAGGLNIMGGIGYAKNANIDGLEITRRLTNISPSINGEYDQINLDPALPQTYRGNLRVDYDLNSKHRLGIDGKYYDNTNKRIATNLTTVDLYNDIQTDYTLTTDNDINRSWNYKSLNPFYIFEIDTSGQKLEFDINLARYQVDGMNTLSTTTSLNSSISKQRYTQPGDSKIFASALDYTRPLSEIFELKVGLKYSIADLDNNLISEYLEDNLWINNTSQSNHYLFDEKIYATYSKLNFSEGTWSGTLGLRYENSKSTGESLTIDSTLTRNISKLFPSFSLSKKIGGGLAAGVAYSYRIDRPRYSTLNPFVYYLDPFTFESGNPNIRPELTHSSKFTLSMEGQPFFNIQYRSSHDAIVEITRQEPDSEEASKIDINFDNQTDVSTSLFFPLSFIPKVNGYAGTIVTNTKYNSLLNEEQFERSNWNTTVFVQAEFTLPGNIYTEIGGWYNSGGQEGIFKSEYLYGTSIGMSKKFLKNKAKISIAIEDPFNRFWNASVDYQQDMTLRSTWQAQVVNARFSYKFGNQHLKTKKKGSAAASEEIRRATQSK